MVYSPLFSVQPALQIELFKKGKSSLDLGYTQKKDTTYGLIGLGYDLNELIDLEAGYATDFKDKNSWYAGFSIEF